MLSQEPFLNNETCVDSQIEQKTFCLSSFTLMPCLVTFLANEMFVVVVVPFVLLIDLSNHEVKVFNIMFQFETIFLRSKVKLEGSKLSKLLRVFLS